MMLTFSDIYMVSIIVHEVLTFHLSQTTNCCFCGVTVRYFQLDVFLPLYWLCQFQQRIVIILTFFAQAVALRFYSLQLLLVSTNTLYFFFLLLKLDDFFENSYILWANLELCHCDAFFQVDSSLVHRVEHRLSTYQNFFFIQLAKGVS